MKGNYDKFSKNRLFICFFYRIYYRHFYFSVRSVILLLFVAIAVNLLIEGFYFPSNFFTPSDFSGMCEFFFQHNEILIQYFPLNSKNKANNSILMKYQN